MGTEDARSAAPQDTRQAPPPTGEGWHLIEELGRSAVDGPLGMLPVEGECLAADRPLTTAEDAAA